MSDGPAQLERQASGAAEEDLSSGGTDSDEDLGALISFANLENVVKHIIRRFKSIEVHDQDTDAEIRKVRADLATRATNAGLAELQSELASRVESFERNFVDQKEQIVNLHEQIERSRVMCGAIEKKLEAVVKEKAVQDRLIRETQDTVQDKVSIAELNMFEAKFAGYATKLEHQELISQLSEYARVDVAERLAGSLRLLSIQFDDYSRTAKIEQQLQELRDWVSDELHQYAKARVTNDKLEEIQAQFREQALGFERSWVSVDDKIRSLSDRATSIYTELNSDMQSRALAEDLREVKDSLRKYAQRADTDAFQQDCAPKLRYCVESIKAFDDRLKAQDDAIQRMDEILLDKAAKYDVLVMNAKVDQCLNKEVGMGEINKLSASIDGIKQHVHDYIESEAERLKEYRPPDYTPMFEELNARVTLKADKADLVEMYQLKANRMDADELARLQDTIHRQLEYLSVTAFGLSKLVLTEPKAGESKSIRAQQKAQVLMQSEALWNWILHNDPPPNLDTLRPPAARRGGGGGSSVSDKQDSKCERVLLPIADKEKRQLDDSKREMLEKKLGISAA